MKRRPTQHPTGEAQGVLENTWERYNTRLDYLRHKLYETQNGPLLLSLIMTKLMTVRRILRNTVASAGSVARARSESAGLEEVAWQEREISGFLGRTRSRRGGQTSRAKLRLPPKWLLAHWACVPAIGPS